MGGELTVTLNASKMHRASGMPMMNIGTPYSTNPSKRKFVILIHLNGMNGECPRIGHLMDSTRLEIEQQMTESRVE